MDLFEAIERRHSYRAGFEDAPIPRDDLQKIVEAGIRAPSGCNAQTTSFVIVDDPAPLGEISEILGNPLMFKEARAVIACVVEHRPVYRGMAFGVEDCSAAVENMLLAITALGYATVWYDGALRLEERAEKIAALLGIPADKELRILLPLGRAKEDCAQKERLPFNQRASFNRYE